MLVYFYFCSLYLMLFLQVFLPFSFIFVQLGEAFPDFLLKTRIQLRKLKDLIGLIKRIHELGSPSRKIERSSVELQKWKGF